MCLHVEQSMHLCKTVFILSTKVNMSLTEILSLAEGSVVNFLFINVNVILSQTYGNIKS